MKKLLGALTALTLTAGGLTAVATPAEAAPRCTYRVNNGSVAPYVDGTCTGVIKHRTVAICWPGIKQRGSFVASGKTSRANCPFVSVTGWWSDYLYDI